jgi:hypothetical protein
MPQKYDWASIEMQYVRGIENEDGKVHWPLPNELAKMLDCSVDYIHTKIREGQWKDKKSAYLLKLELSDGDFDIEDPKAEYEKFQRKAYQAASQTLTIIIKKLDVIIKKQEYNLSDLDKLMKMLERVQLIAKNSIGDNLDNFEDAKSEFERLMKKLKEDEKVEKNLPEPLPAITVTDL